jgi:hypothetical protein
VCVCVCVCDTIHHIAILRDSVCVLVYVFIAWQYVFISAHLCIRVTTCLL